MNMTSLVGNLALVCTIASNFAGLEICMKFFKAKSTGDASALPFITGAMCTALWLHYGILVDDNVLISVNAIAVVLQSCYIGCFYVFSPSKRVLHQQLTVLSLFSFMYLAYVVYFEKNTSSVTTAAGALACAFSVIACASPMTLMQHVYDTKSTEVLPFSIILGAFVVTSLWSIYGILKQDIFLQIPNFIGVLLSGFQLSLFGIYPSKSIKED